MDKALPRVDKRVKTTLNRLLINATLRLLLSIKEVAFTITLDREGGSDMVETGDRDDNP